MHDKHVSDDGKNTQQQIDFLFANPHSGSFHGGAAGIRPACSFRSIDVWDADFFTNVTFRICLR
jgi:hypothetical protein